MHLNWHQKKGLNIADNLCVVHIFLGHFLGSFYDLSKFALMVAIFRAPVKYRTYKILQLKASDTMKC